MNYFQVENYLKEIEGDAKSEGVNVPEYEEDAESEEFDETDKEIQKIFCHLDEDEKKSEEEEDIILPNMDEGEEEQNEQTGTE
jgi:hypothetical protein